MCCKPQTEWKWNRKGQDPLSTRGKVGGKFCGLPLSLPSGLPLLQAWALTGLRQSSSPVVGSEMARTSSRPSGQSFLLVTVAVLGVSKWSKLVQSEWGLVFLFNNRREEKAPLLLWTTWGMHLKSGTLAILHCILSLSFFSKRIPINGRTQIKWHHFSKML